MSCPICGRTSAWNAPPGDPRCGPCHNFRVTGAGRYALHLLVDAETWLRNTRAEIIKAGTLSTYEEWLRALAAAADRMQPVPPRPSEADDWYAAEVARMAERAPA